MESTIPSYFTARPKKGGADDFWREATVHWWNSQIAGFDVFVSELVREEVGGGDADAARRRLAAIAEFPNLQITPEVTVLANAMLSADAVPKKAGADAMHLALAAVHRMDILLTWNMRHIANPMRMGLIRAVVEMHAVPFPQIITPEYLIEI